MSKVNNENIVKFRKEISKLKRETYNEVANCSCLLCNKEKRIIDSHSLPQFVLKCIASNGKVFWGPGLIYPMEIKYGIFDKDCGVNDAGIFHLLCRDCDKTYFSEYETTENYVDINQDSNLFKKMLLQAALKQYLKEFYKNKFNYLLESKMSEKYAEKDILNINNFQILSNLSEVDYKKKAFKILDMLSESNFDNLEIIYYKTVDYKIGIASQCIISLDLDIKGNVIQDKYNFDEKYNLEDLCVLILPFNDYSIICLYHIIFERNIYGEFIKQFNQLKDREKLKIIQASMFEYTEEYYLSENIFRKINRDDNFNYYVKGHDNLHDYIYSNIGPNKEDKAHSYTEYWKKMKLYLLDEFKVVKD